MELIKITAIAILMFAINRYFFQEYMKRFLYWEPLKYILISIFFFLFSYQFKNNNKNSLFVVLIIVFYLFYKSIHSAYRIYKNKI